MDAPAWFDLVPAGLNLAITLVFIASHPGQPVLQIFSLIVASYLNIFPAADFLFSAGEGMAEFARYQMLLGVFFQMPMFWVAHQHALGPRVPRLPEARLGHLPALLPGLLLAGLAGFWFVALNYDLFFRRQGHEALQRATAEVPAALLYVYRAAVETAFFVIVYLVTVVRTVTKSSENYRLYLAALIAYLGTFVLFFGANSRMQFVLLLLCLVATQPALAEFLFKRVRMPRLGLMLLTLVLGLTLFRELVLEDNERIDTADLGELLMAAGWLIAARLDSVIVLYRLEETGFSPWGFELSGLTHVLNFYVSFIADPATYAAIKESLVTSPSVEIVNRLLGTQEVDFPKSMILDMLLSFGVVGLVAVAMALGTAVGTVQRHLRRFVAFTPAYLASIYLLPMLLEFEKEFIGLAFGSMKWLPMLALVYWQRPRFTADEVPVAASARATTGSDGAAPTPA